MKELFKTLVVVIALAFIVYAIQLKKEEIRYTNDVVKQTRKASSITDSVINLDRDQLIELLDETKDAPTLFVPDRVEIPSSDNE